jgi:hypothetical protein
MMRIELFHGGTQLTRSTHFKARILDSKRSQSKAHIRQYVIYARQSVKILTRLGLKWETCSNHKLIPRCHSFIPTFIMQYHSALYRSWNAVRGFGNMLCSVMCLVTKTIYFKNIEDYATIGFLAAFYRFVSQRNLLAHM